MEFGIELDLIWDIQVCYYFTSVQEIFCFQKDNILKFINRILIIHD